MEKPVDSVVVGILIHVLFSLSLFILPCSGSRYLPGVEQAVKGCVNTFSFPGKINVVHLDRFYGIQVERISPTGASITIQYISMDTNHTDKNTALSSNSLEFTTPDHMYRQLALLYTAVNRWHECWHPDQYLFAPLGYYLDISDVHNIHVATIQNMPALLVDMYVENMDIDTLAAHLSECLDGIKRKDREKCERTLVLLYSDEQKMREDEKSFHEQRYNWEMAMQ
jgi:hypothetical protein